MTAAKLSPAAISSLATRLLPLLLLVIPAAVSIGLLSTRDVRSSGSSRVYISRNRPTVAVLVQVIASVLGTLQIAALTLIINYRARITLTKRPIRTDTMDFFSAISIPRIPWNVPVAKVSLAALIVVLAQGPGALWAGSITPATTRESVTLGNILVPKFGAHSRHVWDAEFQQFDNGDVWNYVQNCTSQRTQAVAVTNCPVPNHQAALLDSLRGATGWTDTSRNHSKPDSTAWTYAGRSYGMGASQGLATIQGIPIDHKVLGYSYNETGYETSTHCRYNSSSNLKFELGGEAPNVNVWYVTGLLPISIKEEFYPVMSWARATESESEILAWAGVATHDQYMIGITSSAHYSNFKDIQCTVTFTPRAFVVSVNETSTTIRVNKTTTQTEDWESTGHLKSNSIWSVNLLSRMTTSLYTSVLGDALQQNLDAMLSQDKSITAADGALRSTEDSFDAILDDILGIYAGAQIGLARDVESTAIDTVVEGMRFGDPTFQFSVAVLTAAIVAVVLIEGVLTRWWLELPCFDPLALKAIAAAASIAGPALGKELERRHADLGTQWLGSSADRALGGICVMLVEKAGSLQLALAGGSVSAGDEAGDELTSLTASTVRSA